jgi:hypothetical protein
MDFASPEGTGNLHGHDVRDRLILALYAQLKAERQTRETLEYVIRNGALAPEVLEAIAGDPVPVAVAEDVAAVEKVVALDAGAAPQAASPRRENDDEAKA